MWQKVAQFDGKTSKKLIGHAFRMEIEDAITRYVRALDYNDLHVAFLQLWGLLEALTATTKADYDSTIRRVAFYYEDQELHRQVLQHLRVFRNASVHSGLRVTQIQTLLFQLKRYAERLILIHTDNFLRFPSLADAASFSDLPTDVNDLKRRIAKYKAALKFRIS